MRDSSKRSIYLPSIWQERPASPGHSAVWRISLKDVHTGERQGFANLEQMLAFLEKQMVIRVISAGTVNIQQIEGETRENPTD